MSKFVKITNGAFPQIINVDYITNIRFEGGDLYKISYITDDDISYQPYRVSCIDITKSDFERISKVIEIF